MLGKLNYAERRETMYLLFCAERCRRVLLQPPGQTLCRKRWILCAVGGEMYRAWWQCDDDDAVRKQQATAVWRLLKKRNDAVRLSGVFL
jgi:hypothetical protein